MNAKPRTFPVLERFRHRYYCMVGMLEPCKGFKGVNFLIHCLAFEH